MRDIKCGELFCEYCGDCYVHALEECYGNPNENGEPQEHGFDFSFIEDGFKLDPNEPTIYPVFTPLRNIPHASDRT